MKLCSIKKYINLKLEKNENSHIFTNNICIVISDLFLNYGGLEKTGIELSNFLSSYFNVYIWYKKGKKEKLILDSINANIMLIEYEDQKNIYSFIKKRKHILDINPDCFICMFSWDEMEYWPIILQNTGIPIFYSEHNNPELIISRWNKENRNFILEISDKIRFQWHSFIDNKFKNKSVVIHNGIDLNKKTIQYDNVILYVGRIEKNIKQTNILLDVFNNINIDDLKLRLYGNVFFDVSSYKLNKNIEFNKFTLDKSIIYNNVSFLVIPSIYEGFPNVVLEALMYGIPVIGNKKCSGVNELVIDGVNGFLYENLENDFLKILNKKESLTEMRTNCFNTIKKYNKNIILEEWLINIKNVIKNKGNTALDLWIKTYL